PARHPAPPAVAVRCDRSMVRKECPWSAPWTERLMDRIECMRAFVEAVRSESFAAAARVLDVPRSKVSKQVQALEEALGVQLLMRTTRSLHLTEAGATYYEDARELLAALDEAEQRARGSSGIRGVVRCNVPVSFGRVLSGLVP